MARRDIDQDRYGATNMNKIERECGYWLFLLVVLICFLAVFDKHTVFAALEDGAMELSRLLFSAAGAATLAVLLVVACRCTSDPHKALVLGVVVVGMVGVLGLLKAYVFPSQFLPFEIDGDWFMGTNNTNASSNSSQNGGGENATYIEKEFEYTLDDLNNIGGFLVVPILCIIFFGSIMMGFRINSGKAFIATFFVCFLGCLMAFKVMVLDQHVMQTTRVTTTTPLPLPNTTAAKTLLTTTVEEHTTHPKKSLSEAFLLAAHEPSRIESVSEMGVEAAYASQLAATRGDRPPLGTVERLRAVEAKLDELLSRTASSPSWISKFGFGMH